MRPQTKEDLITWLRFRLGEPVVNSSELHPVQLDMCIEESLDYFTEHGGGVGHEEQFLTVFANERMKEIREDQGVETNAEINVMPNPDEKQAEKIVYKSEYQLPDNVLAVSNLASNYYTKVLENGRGTALQQPDIINLLLSYGGSLSGRGGYGLFYAGTTSQIRGIGGHGNFTNENGGLTNTTGILLGTQYLETIQHMFRARVNIQFLEATRKVRISPPPAEEGFFVLSCWCRVPDEDLYNNLWIKRYAHALSLIQIGRNCTRYTGLTLPNGTAINGEGYLNEGKELKETLEQEIIDNKWSTPPDAFYRG